MKYRNNLGVINDESKNKSFASLSVFHLMRTYGAHGGERQLSQYFDSKPCSNIHETFVFVYRDPECSSLFSSRCPSLEQQELFHYPIKTRTAWSEFFSLLPLLFLLQLRFLILIQRHPPDVIVVHGFQAALIAWPVAMLRRSVRWCYMHRITKSSSYVNFIFRTLYKPYDIIAGNSHAVATSLAPIAGSKRLTVLSNGLDWQNFDATATKLMAPLPKAPELVLVSVGRLLPHKGQAILIDAFSLLADLFPYITLWIVGDGPERKILEKRALASPAARKIHFLGRREDVPAVLSRSDIFINTSAWEGMSNSVLEAMAASLPSVVTDAPGVSECHIDGLTGFVVRPDSLSLIAPLARLLNDLDLRKRMGVAARQHLKMNYSMDKNRKLYLNLFERLTGRSLCADF